MFGDGSAQGEYYFSPRNTNFEGAKPSKDRTYIYYPHLDSQRAVNSLTRGSLMRRSCWAYDNIGFVRGIVNKSAEMCGGSRPKAASGDEEWDKLADEAFERVTGSAEIFDVAGKHDWASMEEAVYRTKFKLGDGALALTESESGMGRIQFYESWQIGNDPNTNVDQSKWSDGVMLDARGKALKYRFLVGDGHRDLGREDVVFFADYERPGQARGLPKTYHAITHVHDSADIMRYMKASVKSTSQIGFVVHGEESVGGSATLGSSVNQRPVGASGDGGKGKKSPDITREEVMEGSKIVKSEDGKIDVVMDDRPSPNQLDFLDYLKRDMSAGWGFPVEIIWNMKDLSGANTRAILRMTNNFVKREHKWFQSTVGRRLRNWIIAKEMKAGRLRMPSTGKWWAHSWTVAAELTADMAKDLRALLEAADTGAIPQEIVSRLFGMDGDEMDDMVIARTLKRMKKCKTAQIDFERTFPKMSGKSPFPEQQVTLVED